MSVIFNDVPSWQRPLIVARVATYLGGFERDAFMRLLESETSKIKESIESLE